MAYVRQARPDGRKMITAAIIGLAAMLMFIAIGVFVIKDPFQKEQYEKPSSNTGVNKQINLLRANQRIQAGETSDVAKFEMVAVPRELAPSGAVTSTLLLKGKRVSGSLEKGEFLMQNDLVDSTAWYEDGDRLMEHIFQDGAIPATVDIGSIVDVKLFRQGSEDPVVISKIAVIGKAQNTLSFYLNPQEQEFLKEASTEGRLFLVQYLDKTQPSSSITYYPSYNKAQPSDKGSDGFTSTSMAKE
jgi:hypothetical protein